MNKRNYLEYIALAALLVTFFGYFAVKVWDIDFWWHIAAGRVILESGAIPSQDPFGIYDAANDTGQTVLKSEWLGQVLLYLAYRFFELDGVIFLRAAVLTTCLGVVYWRCRLAGAKLLFTLIMLALTGMAILLHTGERPQLFSFLYLSLVFLLLDMHLQSARNWPLYLAPPIFLLWANSHGGVVFGVVVLGLFCAGYLLENRLATGSLNTPQNRRMLAVTALSTSAFLLAPNGITTVLHIFLPENMQLRERMVSEYATPWALWPMTVYYWVFFAVTMVSLPGFFGRAYLKQAIVVGVVAAISLTGYRYIPWFALLAAPYIAASLSRMFRRVRLPGTSVNLATLVIALFFLVYGFKQERIFQHGVLEAKYPGAAVAFIKAKHLSGKMFNSMNWGGYLLWNLSPAVTIFVDGRAGLSRLVPYTHILWTTPDGQRFFEQENFDLALVPYGNAFTGERYPLVTYLQNHPDWKTVYQDGAGYLFVRVREGYLEPELPMKDAAQHL